MQKTIWVVDIEASGLSPASYPIEIGVVNGRQEYQSLISPAESWTHWSPESERLHGISRPVLNEKGTPALEVATYLNNLLGASTIYTDHGDWDAFWLQRLFEYAGIRQAFTVADITTLLDQPQMRAFATALDKLSKTSGHRAHRALDDARIIHKAVICALSNGA